MDCVEARRMSTANWTGMCNTHTLKCKGKKRWNQRTELFRTKINLCNYSCFDMPYFWKLASVCMRVWYPFVVAECGLKTSYNCNMLRIGAHLSNQHTDAACERVCVSCRCGISERNDIMYSFDKRLFSFVLRSHDTEVHFGALTLAHDKQKNGKD